MVYVVTLSAAELSNIQEDLRLNQSHTHAYAKDTIRAQANNLVLFVEYQEESDPGTNRSLAWIGAQTNRGVTGLTQDNITIRHMREVHDIVALDGADGLLAGLSEDLRESFDNACVPQSVGAFGTRTWEALADRLRQRHPNLWRMMEWILAVANPPVLSNENPADRSWQEQRDAVETAGRIFKAPVATFSAWRRPSSPDAPYLAGLIPEPVENSLIEHDVRTFADGLYQDWVEDPALRCDIHVLTDERGRRLEIANVNATSVESALGTDMIYYHEPTSSFVLVQYKRLEADKSLSVDPRLLNQLKRLENVSELSKPASGPDDWRLGSDACFLKLAHWSGTTGMMTEGMYLPLSYVRLLLKNDCTLSGVQKEGKPPGRMLGYRHVPRHMVNTQFVDLVQHGYVGTVGVSVENLRELVELRARQGHRSVVSIERSEETSKERQQRNRERSNDRRGVKHTFVKASKHSIGQQTLFDVPPEKS